MKIEKIVTYKVNGITYNTKEDAEKNMSCHTRRLQKDIAFERKVLKREAAELEKLKSLKSYKEVKKYFERVFFSQYSLFTASFDRAVNEMGIKLPKSDLMLFFELVKRSYKYSIKYRENQIRKKKAELVDK